MTRKQFIESHGATCRNWNWSWSFVNHTDRFVIFGAWDRWTEDDRELILADAWETNSKGRKMPGYRQGLEHIRLIQAEGYELRTFPMLYSDEKQDRPGEGPATIQGFIPKLTPKRLVREGDSWFATSM
jgi:5-methylcytosine-specific restriction protein A